MIGPCYMVHLCSSFHDGVQGPLSGLLLKGVATPLQVLVAAWERGGGSSSVVMVVTARSECALSLFIYLSPTLALALSPSRIGT